MTGKRDNSPSNVIVRPDVSATSMVQTRITSGVTMRGNSGDQVHAVRPRRWLQILCLGAVISLAPAPGQAAPLSAQQFAGLAQRCAPSLSLGVLRAVARTESHFDPLALHDNTRAISYSPSSVTAAVSQARRWMAAGDSADLGLMQINTANLRALGLTLQSAFDPCRSLSAGAAILRAAYAHGATLAEDQAALLIALSRYNTGRPLKGLVNGYVGRVLAAHSAAAGVTKPYASREQMASNSAPAWNVWANAAYAQTHGAPWLVGSQDQEIVPAEVDVPISAALARAVPRSNSLSLRRTQ